MCSSIVSTRDPSFSLYTPYAYCVQLGDLCASLAAQHFQSIRGRVRCIAKPEGNHSRDPLFLQCEYAKRRIVKDNNERQYHTFVPKGPFLPFFRLGRDCRAAQREERVRSPTVSKWLFVFNRIRLLPGFMFFFRFHR